MKPAPWCGLQGFLTSSLYPEGLRDPGSMGHGLGVQLPGSPPLPQEGKALHIFPQSWCWWVGFLGRGLRFCLR